MTAAKVILESGVDFSNMELAKRELLSAHVSFLSQIEKRGGPDVADYTLVTEFFHEAGNAIRAGLLQFEDLKNVWTKLGEAFNSSKTMQGHVITRPYGYVGDFEIIDKIYQNWTSPDPRLQKWDHYFHAQQAPNAVRNRKKYFIEILKQMRAQTGNRPLKILNVASGPARDVLEFLSENHQNVHFDCVDQDPRAVAFARKLNAPVLDNITFHVSNIFKFDLTQRYDLVWSAGLFDYLNDKEFRFLLDKLYKTVAPQGMLVVGNFAPINSTRDFMEYGHWFLNHRSDSDLRSLAHAIQIPEDKVSIGWEAQCVNLFLHARKD